MPLKLERPLRKIRQTILEKSGVEIGHKIGEGHFSNVYSVRGDKSRVIKVSICDASVRFLRMVSRSENPHFPKKFQLLGKVGEAFNDGENGCHQAFAYLVERLRPVCWDGEFAEFHEMTRRYTSEQEVGRKTIDQIQDCIGLLESQEASASKIVSPTLTAAFKELTQVLRALYAKHGNSLILDLHEQNYMMRKGGVLVINDPVCNQDLI